MRLGEKLKNLRRYRGMTQNDLAGSFLTRNMLSQIERGAALPSYRTTEYLASALSVDPAYFFNENMSLLDVEYADALPAVLEAYKQKNYQFCLQLSERFFSLSDQQFRYILCDCFYNLGVDRFNNCKFDEALSFFDQCADFGKDHVICGVFDLKIDFYKNLISQMTGSGQVPGVSILSYLSHDTDYSDLVAYTYLLTLLNNGMTDKAVAVYDALHIRNKCYRGHFNARLAAAKMNYSRAKELLYEILESDEKLPYPFIYSIYEDLERYCKATEDYAGAYRCSVDKRKYEYRK